MGKRLAKAGEGGFHTRRLPANFFEEVQIQSAEERTGQEEPENGRFSLRVSCRFAG